jgi:hypothetical protein
MLRPLSGHEAERRRRYHVELRDVAAEPEAGRQPTLAAVGGSAELRRPELPPIHNEYIIAATFG